jgi:hypothetical protein
MAGLALAALGLAWCGLAPTRAQQARPQGGPPAATDEATALVEKQRALSLRALQLIDQSRRIDAPVAALAPETYIWSRHVLEARLYLSLGAGEAKTQDIELYLNQARGEPKPDRVAAFEEHVRRMKSLEDRYRPIYERGQFSTFDFAKVEFYRMQAETWLAREKGRAGGAPR